MILFLAMVLAGLSITPLSGHCNDEISWIYLGFPPVFIEDGPFANQGYGDFVLKVLMDNVTGYTHKRLKCNVVRAQELLRSQANVGHPAFLKRPDRDSYTEVSIPAYVLIPNGVLVPSDQVNKFKSFINANGAFLLERAVTQSKLTVGISAGRAYGGIIDQILTKHKGHQNIFTTFDEQHLLDKLLLMMKAGRIDYLIGYPNEVQYYAKQNEYDRSITCLPVEGMPDYFLGYIAFPKNAWGKSIVEKINPILEKHRNTPEYHAAYEFWLDQKSIERYRRYVREVYRD